MTRARAIAIRPPAALLLGVASLAGLVMFLWPLFVDPPAGTARATDAPFAFALILPIVLAVVLVELRSGGLDVKALAMLGLLGGLGAALRPMGAGTAGIETVFFLLVLAGRVYGAGFGFLLGNITLLTSALLTGGVGPWLPFQMLASAWIGLVAGLLPRASGRTEIVILAIYGALAAYAFGFLLNMYFWPYTGGVAYAGENAQPGLQFVPGAPVWENLQRFFWFSLATSTAGWDTGRAITNVVAISTLGRPVLAALHRSVRKANFDRGPQFVESPHLSCSPIGRGRPASQRERQR